jgi:hypothetical protein
MHCSVEEDGPIKRVERLSIFGLALLAGFASQAAAQNSEGEFWPEIKTFIHLNTSARLFVLTAFRDTEYQNARSWTGDFGVHLDFALKPVFRRELGAREDVYEKRFLTFLTGYRYITSLGQGSAPERRWVVEMTSRFPLPGKLVLSDRSRGEMRFLSSGFSTRYRNRLQAERDLNPGGYRFTPYASAEAFYDTRYDTWNRMRYILGIRFPARGHFILETYFQHQNDRQSTPQRVNVLGVTLNLYF